MLKNARSLIILGLIAIAGTTYGFSSKSPEEIIAESIRKSNIEINIRNTAVLEQYQSDIRDCTKSQTGSNTEVLQKLSTCINRPKPKLEELIATVGDSNNGMAIDNAKASTAGVIAEPPKNKAVSIECEFGERSGNVEGIELHYTATDDTTTLQSIKNSHIAKGQEHIGYHFVVKANGEITNTRDEKCVAGADKWSRNNYRFIQIAFVGNDKPTDRQTESMAILTKDLQIKYKLPIDSVSAHSEWGPKSKKESLEYWYGSKAEFVKKLRIADSVTIYGKQSAELTYMWSAWGDKDFIGTIFQESRMSNDTIGDGGQSIGYCQIHKGYQPGWYAEYSKLQTMESRLNYCHEKYVYSASLSGGVGSRFHGWNKREEHIKNITIQ